MRIVTLMENTPGPAACRYAHGLSLYIETAGHRLLADTGPDDGFLRNAELLGIDLSAVDAVFLSHGHYDHADGIPALASTAPDAVIYLQRSALGAHYGMDPEGPRYIGADRRIATLPNLRFLDGDAVIDRELSVLAGFTGQRRRSVSNLRLKLLTDDGFVQDSFAHEQALVVREDGRYYLFSGCAHNGILNILDRFRAVYGRDPYAVLSGFHFMKPAPYTPEEAEDITATAEELARMDTVFYTGHCTSQPAYDLMKPIMGDRLHALHSGAEVEGL